ncbi:FkbM family methyltransferase [Erythrobacter dokdonensis]|uniref:Methyltransferase FkbM family protein n=1 Tax=Erythrobacter dokdonensis DSW-74 TaxID=1300349 RepID=A0A1A7BLL8_9SPHN|nr:FkbM family methyltransferase [Erythrobacter dokdonensis]OBV12060.1 Methyltransferase FkbM family protein [Erythrobacter dokdonensis DSW-74]
MLDAVRRLGLHYLSSGRTIPQASQLQRFLDKDFLIQTLRQLQIDCVLDVGANRGQYAESLRDIGYTGEIHSFEPIPGIFDLLSQAAASDPHWHVHNFALGQTAGTSEFNLVGDGGPNSVYSSFLSPAHSTIPERVTTISVVIKTLDSLIDVIAPLNDPERRLFLKMDTQGYDIEVCEGAKTLLPRILGLQTEISVTQIYAGQPDYIEALRYCRDLGFSLMNLSVVSRTEKCAVLEYDCVMARLD